MSYPKETKRAAQDAYHEARAFGHTKEEARGLRDNWKPSPSSSGWSDDDDDDIIWSSNEPYDQDCIDD
jgi:hypothetical protein